MVFGNDLVLPIPHSVAGITSFSGLSLPTPLLTVGYSGEVAAKENSITCKQTLKPQNGINFYIYNVEMNIEGGNSIISRVLPDISGTDHNVVVETADGEQYLIYELPNAFSVDYTYNMKEAQLKFSITSLNDFIEIR